MGSVLVHVRCVDVRWELNMGTYQSIDVLDDCVDAETIGFEDRLPLEKTIQSQFNVMCKTLESSDAPRHHQAYRCSDPWSVAYQQGKQARR